MRPLEVARIAGVAVRVHPSLALMCVLLAGFTSAEGIILSPLRDHRISFSLGVAEAALYCASISLHEVGHFIALRHFNLRVDSITFNAWGGRTKSAVDDIEPGVDAAVAAAGPLTTLLLAVLGFGLFYTLGSAGNAFARSAGLALAILNLAILPGCAIPVWPTDTYRVVRAVAWKLSGDALTGTRFACRFSAVVIWLLVMVGAVTMIYPVSPALSRLGPFAVLVGAILAIQTRGMGAMLRQVIAARAST